MRTAALLLAAAVSALAAPEGRILLGPDSVPEFKLRGEPKGVTLTVVDQAPVGKVLRVLVGRKTARAADVRLSAMLPEALKKGDILLATFLVRAGDSRWDANLSVAFEPGDTPWSRALEMPVEGSWDWKKYQYPFTIRRDVPAGKGELSFFLGSQIQVVDIAGLELANYGPAAKIEQLPVTRYRYLGQDAGAAWRKAAAERIERIRKADLRVEVKNASGKPLRGADVSIRMRKHAFGFGTCINAPLVAGLGRDASDSDVRMYHDKVKELFNKTVIENHLKWPQWAEQRQRPAAIQAVNWLNEAGIAVRGHCLVWPSWRWTPVPEALRVKDDPPSLAKVVLDHIAEEAGAMSGKLAEWDVINEPFSNHDLMDILGKRAMVDWFQAARKADPGAKLFINDYEILSGNNAEHQNHYFETIRYLIDAGAPVEGIGLQGHFPARLTPPEELMRRLDRFAQFGKPLQITEFDVDTNDEQAQADYTRDVMTVMFSHPATSGFLMWGFWEGSHWKPKCAMYRTDWSEKPNARAYRDLVFGQWWTNASGKTAADGAYSARAFLGEYEIEVRSGKRTKKVAAKLEAGAAPVTVVLE